MHRNTVVQVRFQSFQNRRIQKSCSVTDAGVVDPEPAIPAAFRSNFTLLLRSHLYDMEEHVIAIARARCVLVMCSGSFQRRLCRCEAKFICDLRMAP